MQLALSAAQMRTATLLQAACATVLLGSSVAPPRPTSRSHTIGRALPVPGTSTAARDDRAARAPRPTAPSRTAAAAACAADHLRDKAGGGEN